MERKLKRAGSVASNVRDPMELNVAVTYALSIVCRE